jgi:CRP-like cAMP-binding protein
MVSSTSALEPLIRKLELHSTLLPAERTALLSLPVQRRAVAAHAQLFQAGEPTRHCCVLLDGYAIRHKLMVDGGRQILNILMRGDLVGIQRALFGHADHGVEMLTPGAVAVIPADALDALLSDHPGLVRVLWADTLSGGAIEREWICNVGRRDARSRIAHLFCELAVRHEQLVLGQRTEFKLALTQTHIADCAGLTAIHVNRVLQSLRADDLIKTEQRRLTIKDWNGLTRVGDFDERYLHAEQAPSVRQPQTSQHLNGKVEHAIAAS